MLSNSYKLIEYLRYFNFISTNFCPGGSKVSPESMDWIETAASCLSLEADDLRQSLTSRLMQTKNLKKGTTYM